MWKWLHALGLRLRKRDAMAFAPGRTVKLDAGKEAVSVPLDAELPQVMVTNLGPEMVFVRFGTGRVGATTGDFPVLAETQVLLAKGVGADWVSAVCYAEDRATVFVTVGSGF
jgi:hypothetical protein